MAKKRKCRYTTEELEVHNEAVKLRKMTDEQLVMAFRGANSSSCDVLEDKPSKPSDGIRKLLDGLSRGDCKGIKGATVYKLTQYAEEVGLI